MYRVRGKLDLDGAIVRVLVGLTATEAEAIGEQGRPAPAPFATTVLIDTGASQTAISPFVVEYLRLVQSDTAEVLVPEKPGMLAERTLPTYDVTISLEVNPQFSRELEAVGAVLATRSALVLKQA